MRGYQVGAAELRFSSRWHAPAREVAGPRIAETLPAGIAPPEPLEPGRLYEVMFRSFAAVGAIGQAPRVVVGVGELGRLVAVVPQLPGQPPPLVPLVREVEDEPLILASSEHVPLRCVRAGRPEVVSLAIRALD